jgi:hypothetical protein
MAHRWRRGISAGPVDIFAISSLILSGMSRYTKANHRVFMRFVRLDVWHVTFLEPGLQTPLPKTLTFKDEGKIRELARRGEAAKGEGGVYLRLSPYQYARLRQSSTPLG